MTRKGGGFQVSADELGHLPGLPGTRSLAVLLQDKLQGWPHVGPLQPGPARTIAHLCWAHLAFLFSASDHSLSHILPCLACVFTERRALNCLWFHRAPSIKSRTVWKRPPGRGGKNHPGFWHGAPPAFFSRCLSGDFPLRPGFSSLACGTGAHTEEAMTDRCDDLTRQMRRWGSFPYVDI